MAEDSIMVSLYQGHIEEKEAAKSGMVSCAGI
jgi:hypothetical protein